jgi:hypothetical protein
MEYFIYGLLKDAERTSGYIAFSQRFFHEETPKIMFHIPGSPYLQKQRGNW